MRIAKLQGYDPTVFTVIKEEYITDVPRSSHPLKATLEIEKQLLETGNIRS